MMTRGLNKVCLLGNVGRKPEIRTMRNGKEIASFTFATSEVWIDKQSKERKTKTKWHKITVFSERLVKLVKAYVEQGSKLYLEGSLGTTKWDEAKNIERTTADVVLQGYNSELLLLDSRGKTTIAKPSTIEPSVSLYEDYYPANEDEKK